jgi:hypothetical protein
MGAESTSAAKETETAAPTVTGAGGPGGAVAFVHGLQRSIGNHAISKLVAGNRLQRDDPPGGGMTSSKGASEPGSPGPQTSEPTPGQKDARARIDEAKKQFKEDAFFAQSAMKAIEPGDLGGRHGRGEDLPARPRLAGELRRGERRAGDGGLLGVLRGPLRRRRGRA